MKDLTEEQWCKPFTPDFILQNKDKFIPQEMIKAVNILLSEKYNGNSATLKQFEIIQKFLEISGSKYSRNEIFDKHYLDFEEIFRNAGWEVKYDKPGYDEDYDENFKFTKNKKR